jgi:methyltransferase family protein
MSAIETLPLARLRAEPWYIDRIAIEGNRLRAEGWSMPVDAREPDEGWFTINGRRFDRIAYPLRRDDVGALFWQRRDAANCGFIADIDELAEPYPDGMLEIRRVRADTPRVEQGRDSWFVPDPARHAGLPDEDRRYRVIGDRDARGFLVSGATDYRRLDRALVEITGRRMHDHARVLDWGVGCGRIARHFPPAHARALSGCDIDHDNVDWCRSHLPGTFVASALIPPLPFPDEAFDLVYGISVFTHLREPMQLRWLAELSRITQPGAVLMMTTHGGTAIDFSRLGPDAYADTCTRVARDGIVVSGTNSQLDGHADHAGEYVNVYHSEDYVRRTWGCYFDVLAILPGYILHHDLVVMRKR